MKDEVNSEVILKGAYAGVMFKSGDDEETDIEFDNEEI